jgi:poly(3-hydroxybutyrate) depolymerase
MLKINLILLLTFLAVPSYGAVPKLNIDLSDVTVSGLSSGGYMATQFHLAHSDWVSGIGVIAAGPYFCAQNDIKTALSRCVNKTDNTLTDQQLKDFIIQAAKRDEIAATVNLKDSKVWILHGSKDQTVISSVSDMLFSQYSAFVAKPNIVYVNNLPFSHHFPTLNEGSDCGKSEAPFIGKCQFDAAAEMLKHIVGELAEKSSALSGKLLTFDQQKLGGEAAESLADEGYVYVPEACLQGQECRAHVSFHGCNQNIEAVGNDYASKTGINHWADSNNLVVLYPQTKKSLFMPLNPQACWDWWGYTDEQYATKNAQQVVAVKNMLEQLAN